MESKEMTVAAPGGAIASIVPQSITEVQTLATMIAKASWAPKSYLDQQNKPDESKIALGIMQGLEVGLKPIQALQSIAVVNGIPSLYGDGALAVLYASGVVEDFTEEQIVGDWKQEKGVVVGYRCTLRRKGRPTPTVREFTLEMAERANLLGKTGPWQQYRPRMLQMRARAWTMRDGAADVLKGMAIFEEVQDVEVTVVPQASTTASAKSATGKLDAFNGKSKEEPVVEAEFTEATSELPMPPEDVVEAYTAGKFSAFVKWFAESQVTDWQAFADCHMPALLKVRGASDRNKAVIDNLAATKGFAMMEPQEEAADGEG